MKYINAAFGKSERIIRSASIILLAFPIITQAHHSTAFYSEEIVELEGELVGVEWRNPHVTWQLMVTSNAGEEELWFLEAASRYPLQRAGVSRDLFVIGEHVRVVGKKSRREGNVMLATNMFLPKGRELLLWGNIAVHFGDASRSVDAARENRGIFRVWSTPAELFPDIQRRLSDLPYTPQAIAARTQWNPINNFVTRCEQEGMPRIMVNPHPFEFIDRGDTITLRMELYDIERTIDMTRSEPAEDEPWSHLGYSVGRWQGDSLVVTTTRVDWPFFDNIGTPQSKDVEIVETFALNDEQGRIDLHITVTDPDTFLEPATIIGYWIALGESVPQYDCQPGRPGA